MFDADNGNTNWKEAELLELNQIYNFDPFNSPSTDMSNRITPGHINIKLHLIYEYKQDVRYKSRMVDSDNFTGPNLDTYHSSAISLRSMSTAVFLDELNCIEIRTSGISNTYITACTTEKIFFNARPGFAPYGNSGNFF